MRCRCHLPHYWQTETDWPIPRWPTVWSSRPHCLWQPSEGHVATDVKLIDEVTGEELTEPNQKAWLPSRARCPRLHADRVARRRAFRRHLLEEHSGPPVYSTFDWGIPRRQLPLHPGPYRRRDQRGRPPPGHARDRGTISSHQHRRGGRGRVVDSPGQVAMALCRYRATPAAWTATPHAKKRVMKRGGRPTGRRGQPSRVIFVTALPKDAQRQTAAPRPCRPWPSGAIGDLTHHGDQPHCSRSRR